MWVAFQTPGDFQMCEREYDVLRTWVWGQRTMRERKKES